MSAFDRADRTEREPSREDLEASRRDLEALRDHAAREIAMIAARKRVAGSLGSLLRAGAFHGAVDRFIELDNRLDALHIEMTAAGLEGPGIIRYN